MPSTWSDYRLPSTVYRLALCASVVLFSAPISARAAELTVFAAASLTDAFQQIGSAFERAHPGTHVTFDFAASSLLRTQIEQGAPADVFASADRTQMAPLARSGKVRGVVPLARNQLVVIVPAANPGHIRRLEDLARPGLRLVITAEPVPIGHYTRQALARMSAPGALGASFQQRVLANVISQEPNVRELVAKVELGEADAAIVYASDAVASGRKVKVIPIPERYNEIAIYPVAVVTASPHPGEAGAFVQYLRSRPAQTVLQRCGFQPVVRSRAIQFSRESAKERKRERKQRAEDRLRAATSPPLLLLSDFALSPRGAPSQRGRAFARKLDDPVAASGK